MLQTTTIGAYPKPSYVPIHDWFRSESTTNYVAPSQSCLSMDDDWESAVAKATEEVVKAQYDAGIEVLTDGEIRRENYIYYHLRHLEGVSFDTLTERVMRAGSWKGKVPTVTSQIKTREPFLHNDYRFACTALERVGQVDTTHHVKMTIPGPMTICDSTANTYYNDNDQMAHDLALAIQFEARHLARAGCPEIQIDEPVFARHKERALASGIRDLETCFEGVDSACRRTVHICCGYPDKVDNPNFRKGDTTTYSFLAEALDNSSIDAISVEDAHCHTDLSFLSKYKRASIILGVVAIASTKIESVDHIRGRILEALQFVPPERLMIAPDCGLGLLTPAIANKKLQNMCLAAHQIRSDLQDS